MSRAEIRRRMEELEAGERHARERLELYRAKVYGSQLTSLERLRQLEHAWELAKTRLHRARSTEHPVRINVDGSAA